jgi:hypothetical protein
VNLTRADRRRLEAIVACRSAPQKHVWRAKIILATAEGRGTAEIMRRSGEATPVVWTGSVYEQMGCSTRRARRQGAGRNRSMLPSADTAATLFWALLVSGQINMRKLDGWQTLATKPIDQPIDLAA